MAEQILEIMTICNVPLYGGQTRPPTTIEVLKEEIVRCRDCKHYLQDKIYVIEGMPLMGNHVCEKWGGGCRTDENGFCHMGERRESNETD